MKKLLIIATLILSGALSYAYQVGDTVDGRWVRMGRDVPRGGILYYDSQTITNTQIWIRTIYPTRQHIGNGKQLNESKILFSADCQNKQLAIISTVLLLDDRVVGNDTFRYPQYIPVVPDTVMEGVYNHVCQ